MVALGVAKGALRVVRVRDVLELLRVDSTASQISDVTSSCK
jgi:hypothetical protein